MNTYKIFQIPKSVEIELVSTHSAHKIKNVLFKIRRTSISEAIFESHIATRAKCEMETGNTYKIKSDGDILYVHCDWEFAIIGTSIIDS